MTRIFLSYSHKDKRFAQRLNKRLQEQGVHVWIDELEIRVGDSLIAKIEAAIEESDYLAVILSPDSVSSKWVQQEVHAALTEELRGKKLKILPILYKECDIPKFLSDKVYADFTKDFRRGLEQLSVRLTGEFSKGKDSVKGFELQIPSGYKTCLLISDGTDFAAELGSLAEEVGFRLVTVPFSARMHGEMLDFRSVRKPDFVILTRGEHFIRGEDRFYVSLTEYVLRGGLLLATPWVVWETVSNNVFADVLPFTAQDTPLEFVENRLILGQHHGMLPKALQLFPNQISCNASFEILQSKPGTSVLFETDTGVPLFGYGRHGMGICYYLNVCQHYCKGSMSSPFQDNPELASSIRNTFQWICDDLPAPT